jgi:hypothetical protein
MNEDMIERKCIFSIIGSPQQVAEALYVCSLPFMTHGAKFSNAVLGEAAPAGALSMTADALLPQNLGLLSLGSIHPAPPLGPNGEFSRQNWGCFDTRPQLTLALDHIGSPAEEQSSVSRVRAHITGEWHCWSEGYPTGALLTLSKRCPEVLIACHSYDTDKLGQHLKHGGFFGGVKLPDGVSQAPCSAASEPSAWSAIQRLVPLKDGHEALLAEAARHTDAWMLQVFSSSDSDSKRRLWPAAIEACSDGGPGVLVRVIDALREQAGDPMLPESIARTINAIRTPSGFGLIDAALASPVHRFARHRTCSESMLWPFDGFIGPYDRDHEIENAVLHLQDHRINALAALCASDYTLAAIVGSDAGALASGVHVVTLMARLAKPGTPQDAGVKQILDRATFTLPEPEIAVASLRDADLPMDWTGTVTQHARMRTLFHLAGSGNSHAWNFLLDLNNRGLIRGFDKRFLASTTLFTDDLPRWLETHGTAEALDLVENARREMPDGVVPRIRAQQEVEQASRFAAELFSHVATDARATTGAVMKPMRNTL